MKKGFTPLQISKFSRKRKFVTGFTLIELAISMVVFVTALVSLLGAFVYCFALVETARNLTAALNAAQDQIEALRYSDFDSLAIGSGTFYTVYIPTTHVGKIEVSYFIPGNTDIKKIRAAVAWQQGTRWIGEQNGQDLNGNGQLDSPCEIVSLISKR